jgi:hypothetical protein
MHDRREALREALERFEEQEIQEAAQATWRLADEIPASALNLLVARDFYPQLAADMEKAGLVREKRNALATYIVGTSRLQQKPLNEIIKGPSSVGKNHLAKTVFKFFPDGEVVSASSVTEHAIHYARTNLSHKIVYIDEHTGVKHPLRQLISEGRLTRWVAEMVNGHRAMVEHVTEGPVACVTTTTENALEIDDESRNLSVWMDESYKQTQEIAKAHVSKREPLSPERLKLWHEVQYKIAEWQPTSINTPPFFGDIAEKILPWGDLRIRRYWPAFVEACKVVTRIRTAAWQEEDEHEVTVSFEDFATALCIFDKLIGESLTRSGGDAEMAIGDLVERLDKGRGVTAADLVGQQGIRSPNQAYRALRRARDAGAIFVVNEHERNNEKRHARSPVATFLGTPEYVVNKLGLKISGSYVHPVNGKRVQYGN